MNKEKLSKEPQGNEDNTLLSVVLSFFKTKTCKHEFRGKDMQPRDNDGNVSWACYKCGKVFVAECGLDVLKNGKCIGEWGFSK